LTKSLRLVKLLSTEIIEIYIYDIALVFYGNNHEAYGQLEIRAPRVWAGRRVRSKARTCSAVRHRSIVVQIHYDSH